MRSGLYEPSAADWWHLGELERSFEGIFIAMVLLAADGTAFTVTSPQMPDDVCAELARQAVAGQDASKSR
jgi:hypothetical protein